jgi:hypothetical protein
VTGVWPGGQRTGEKIFQHPFVNPNPWCTFVVPFGNRSLLKSWGSEKGPKLMKNWIFEVKSFKNTLFHPHYQ